MTPPRFSLIIPAYNEAELLPRLVETVEIARSRYRQGRDAIEIVVSDNTSNDATPDIARERGCKVATVAERCIAAVRNGGAQVAAGQILCFVDADMRIHPEIFNVIDEAVETGRYVAGATGVRLERMSIPLALTYAAMLPMVWITKMDTGVVFCSREDFDAIGGYNESLRLAEDVRFLLDLRKHGRKTRRRLCRLTTAKAISSVRKFDEHGDWHYFKLMAAVALWPLLPERRRNAFMKTYWYGDQRENKPTRT